MAKDREVWTKIKRVETKKTGFNKDASQEIRQAASGRTAMAEAVSWRIELKVEGVAVVKELVSHNIGKEAKVEKDNKILNTRAFHKVFIQKEAVSRISNQDLKW